MNTSLTDIGVPKNATLPKHIEQEFDQKMGSYTDGKSEFGGRGSGVKGFWLRSGMDGDIDQEALKSWFAQTLETEIEKAVEAERERLTRNALNSTNPDYLPSWYKETESLGSQIYKTNVPFSSTQVFPSKKVVFKLNNSLSHNKEG